MVTTDVRHTADGLSFITLTNALGATVELCTLGARWTRCCVPDGEGRLGNVLVGSDDYVSDTLYRGAIVGRVANRIADASFVLDGQTFRLDANDGRHSNHGGFCGFDCRRWDYRLLADGVCFTLTSPDGDGGYPGRVDVEATYRWTDGCQLLLRLRATADRPTLLNPTCHAYFNLSAGQCLTIADHQLQTDATRYVETSADHIPTGRVPSVATTPFDFRQGRPLGRFRFNHCFDVQSATLTDPHSGRRLQVETSLPGLLLYTSGWSPRPFEGVCLEPQFWPDAPHHPAFRQPLLRPGDVYDHTVNFRFS